VGLEYFVLQESKDMLNKQTNPNDENMSKVHKSQLRELPVARTEKMQATE
jgi:hypothetical protein